MKKVTATGVKFKRAGKIYDFLSNNLGEKVGNWVIIEAEKGEDMAMVVIPAREIEVSDEQEMKRVIRLAEDKDQEARKQNIKEAEAAMEVCRELVQKNELDMKLLFSEYTLDKSKLTFYYTADNRVDFRQLVRDLARVYRTRIEMRQIGVRDATKILGGFGICGRELCCASFLRKFDNISIKTAKGQNLTMNPSKISGICGRLMCCLVYEKGVESNFGQTLSELGIDDLADITEIVVGEEAEGEL